MAVPVWMLDTNALSDLLRNPRGTPIGSHDLFMAAHARSRGITLVTRNTREFTRVPGLQVEDWLAVRG